jgi:hypothetical protein
VLSTDAAAVVSFFVESATNAVESFLVLSAGSVVVFLAGSQAAAVIAMAKATIVSLMEVFIFLIVCFFVMINYQKQ